MTYHISTHKVTPDNTDCRIMTFISGGNKMASADLTFGDLSFDVFCDSPTLLIESLEKIVASLKRYTESELPTNDD